MSLAAPERFDKIIDSKIIFLGESAYALRGYGVTLGHRRRIPQTSAAKRRHVIPGRDRQALGVPNFSRKAASLLDAMAASSS